MGLLAFTIIALQALADSVRSFSAWKQLAGLAQLSRAASKYVPG
jgi:hypothetical protein